MTDIIIQPTSVYIGLAITGIFTGLGVAVGGSINKLWLEPKLKRFMKKSNLKKVLRKKKMLNDRNKKVLKMFIFVALIILALLLVFRIVENVQEAREQEKRFNECLSYCFSPLKTEANPLTRSTKFCDDCFLNPDLALALTEATQ